jgi:CheY-like chemotaxis protein
MTAVEERSGAKRHILLVDNVELNRVLASAVLGSAHYDVDCVSDGPSAAAALEGGDYDLVLLNLGVPDLDPVVAACRQKGADTPKLVSLSKRQRHGGRDATIAALDAHIVRPTIPADLIRAVERVLTAPAIWRREVYVELVKHLGVTRMNDLLVDLLALGNAMAETIARAASNIEIDRRAHDLASVSGMFGFDAVSQGCFAVLRNAGGGAARRQAIANLVDALRRANVMIRAAVGPEALAIAA